MEMKDIILSTAKIFSRLLLLFVLLAVVGAVARIRDWETGLTLGVGIGFVLASVVSVYILIGLMLFKFRLFFYSNVSALLGNRNIIMEGPASDARNWRVRHGGLFLTNDSILFMPQRFSIDQQSLILKLDKIRDLRKVGISLLKFFAGGLRERLIIKMDNEQEYQFNVIDTDGWISRIKRQLEEKGSRAS